MPLDHAVTSFPVFAQAFFEKACGQTFFENVCVAPKPLRRFITPLSGVFDKAFLKSLQAFVFDQTFFEKVCGRQKKVV
jgi:hypothetical protein